MGREVYKKVSKRCDARTRLDDIKREYVHRSASYFSFQEMFSIYDYGEAKEEGNSFATVAFGLIKLTLFFDID